MKNTVIKRSLSKNYNIIDNDLWTDMHLTGDGLRVLGYLLSKPDGWVIREKDIRKNFAKVGEELASKHFFRKVIKNLQEAGYLRKSAVRDEAGKITEWVTELADFPMFRKGFSLEEYPVVENPASGPENQLLKKQHVDFTTCGKSDPLSNTDSISNTELVSKKEDSPPPVDTEPLGMQWSKEADIEDSIRANPLMYKTLRAELKRTNTLRSRFPEFIKAHPKAQPQDVVYWIEREWPRHHFYNGEKPVIGTLILDFKLPQSEEELRIDSNLDQFYKGNFDYKELPIVFQKVIRENNLGKGVPESQIPQRKQEVKRLAAITTA